MYWQAVYMSPCCKTTCKLIKDKLAGRHLMRCGACKKLVSKSRCEKQHVRIEGPGW